MILLKQLRRPISTHVWLWAHLCGEISIERTVYLLILYLTSDALLPLTHSPANTDVVQCWLNFKPVSQTLGECWKYFFSFTFIFSHESLCNCLNPLSPHDAIKHHFTSLKTYLIFSQLGFFNRQISMKLFYEYVVIYHPAQTNNIGIQMKRKGLTKTFMMISNRRKPFVLLFYIQRVNPLIYNGNERVIQLSQSVSESLQLVAWAPG